MKKREIEEKSRQEGRMKKNKVGNRRKEGRMKGRKMTNRKIGSKRGTEG